MTDKTTQQTAEKIKNWKNPNPGMPVSFLFRNLFLNQKVFFFFNRFYSFFCFNNWFFTL